MKSSFDIIDRKILTFLQEDARITLTKMARRLYISRNAVRYRIELMEKEGLIEGYTTVINHMRTGNPILVVILFNIKPSNILNCIKLISGFDEVVEIFRLDSENALLVTVFFKNAHHKRTFIMEKIQEIPIENYIIHTVYQIVERKGIPVKYLD